MWLIPLCRYAIMLTAFGTRLIAMSTEPIELTAFTPGQRLDKLIAARLEGFSRTQIQTLIKDGLVMVDGNPAKPGIKLKGGEQVCVTLPQTADAIIQPENLPLNVVYEDDDLAVIDKAAGMVVHPAVGNESGTLVNAMIARWPQIAEIEDPDGRMGIVHRLDKGTSGLILVAKNMDALENLMGQFQDRTVEKTYIALLERTPRTATGHIDAPIARDPKQRKRLAVVRSGKSAITDFSVIDDDFQRGQALVTVRPQTGRTHQIRVHMAFIGCPVVGDTVYGFRKQRVRLKRLFLHAAALSFDHPATGERLHFESDLPPGLQNVMTKLRH
jgi:23S rRNA pseudouridine1911/1915/1917 synthase